MNYRMKMKIRILLIIVALALFGGLVSIKAEAAPRYLKSATYVSDAWVINFWNTESDHMDEELEQIASDGFNSIVLVIPWREFQPRVSPVSYNDYAFDKLDRCDLGSNRLGLPPTEPAYKDHGIVPFRLSLYRHRISPFGWLHGCD